MKYIFIAIALGLACTATLQADTMVSLDLQVDEAAKMWEVLASVADPNDQVRGIDTFRFDVWGENGLHVATSTNNSPTGTDYRGGINMGGFFIPANPDAWGFSELRSDGVAGINIMAGQRSAGPGASALAVLQGVGETAGSRQAWWKQNPYAGGMDTPSGAPVTWSMPAVLAWGTYTGDVGSLFVGRADGQPISGSFALLKKMNSGGWTTGVGSLVAPTDVAGDMKTIGVPEPTTLVMLAMGALGLLLLRRRRV